MELFGAGTYETNQISLREIAKRPGISRRHLRSETVEPACADRRFASAVDAYAFKLSTWLKTESTKSRKQKRSLKQMHADLRVLGFECSYDRVAAFSRQWKADQLDRVSSASKGTLLTKVRNECQKQPFKNDKNLKKNESAQCR